MAVSLLSGPAWMSSASRRCRWNTCVALTIGSLHLPLRLDTVSSDSGLEDGSGVSCVACLQVKVSFVSFSARSSIWAASSALPVRLVALDRKTANAIVSAQQSPGEARFDNNSVVRVAHIYYYHGTGESFSAFISRKLSAGVCPTGNPGSPPPPCRQPILAYKRACTP